MDTVRARLSLTFEEVHWLLSIFFWGNDQPITAETLSALMPPTSSRIRESIYYSHVLESIVQSREGSGYSFPLKSFVPHMEQTDTEEVPQCILGVDRGCSVST